MGKIGLIIRERGVGKNLQHHGTGGFAFTDTAGDGHIDKALYRHERADAAADQRARAERSAEQKTGSNKNGIREYTDENCASIAFIKCMRAADVSIEGLAAYLELYRQDGDTRSARRKILLQEKQRLSERMRHMQEALDRLDTKLRLLDES